MPVVEQLRPLLEKNERELSAVKRMLRRASGFVLAFVRVNHASLRTRAIQELRNSGIRFCVVNLDAESAHGITEQLEFSLTLDAGCPLFVTGLEALLARESQGSQKLLVFNLNRDYCSRRFLVPVVFWVNDSSMVEFSRQAPDLWSGRSGVYHLLGTSSDIEQTLTSLWQAPAWHLTGAQRRERRMLVDALRGELTKSSASDELFAMLDLYSGRLAAVSNNPDQALEEWRIASAHARHSHSDHLQLLSLMESATLYLTLDRYVEAEESIKFALAIAPGVDDAYAFANCRKILADIQRGTNRLEEAKGSYHDAQSLFRRLQRSSSSRQAIVGIANCTKGLGDVELQSDRYSGAKMYYLKALKQYKDADDLYGQANCLKSIGDQALSRGGKDSTTAKGYLQEALTLYETMNDDLGVANCWKGFADVSFTSGSVSEALEYGLKALPVYVRLGVRLGEANCLKSLGDYATSALRFEDAEMRYSAASQIYRLMNNPRGEAHCLQSFGDLALRRSALDQAGKLYETARRFAIQVADRSGQAKCLRGLGEVRLMLAQTSGRKSSRRIEHAKSYFRRALSLYRDIHLPVGEGHCERGIADSLTLIGEHVEAISLYRTALRIFSQQYETLGIADCWLGIARTQLRQEYPHKALRNVRKALMFYERFFNEQANHSSRSGTIMLGVPLCLLLLGDIHCFNRDYNSARPVYSDALARFRAQRALLWQSVCMQRLATLADTAGSVVEGQALHEEATSLRRMALHPGVLSLRATEPTRYQEAAS